MLDGHFFWLWKEREKIKKGKREDKGRKEREKIKSRVREKVAKDVRLENGDNPDDEKLDMLGRRVKWGRRKNREDQISNHHPLNHELKISTFPELIQVVNWYRLRIDTGCEKCKNEHFLVRGMVKDK